MSGARRTSGVSGTDTWTIDTEPLDTSRGLHWWQRWRWHAWMPGRQHYIGSKMSSGMGFALTPSGALRAARRYVASEQRREERWERRLARSTRETR